MWTSKTELTEKTHIGLDTRLLSLLLAVNDASDLPVSGRVLDIATTDGLVLDTVTDLERQVRLCGHPKLERNDRR